jgi:F0F1-type ATP synthase assembly protein I
MKLLKTDVRVNPRDSLGQGMDSVMVLVLFFVAGFFADRWLGTTPWLMIVLTVLGSVGIFYKLKAGYSDRMDQLDAERIAARRAREQAAGS